MKKYWKYTVYIGAGTCGLLYLSYLLALLFSKEEPSSKWPTKTVQKKSIPKGNLNIKNKNDYSIASPETQANSSLIFEHINNFLINNTLSIGNLDEFKKGHSDFHNWGSGLITGSLNFVLKKLSNKLNQINAVPNSIRIEKTSQNRGWQRSNLKDFTARIQVSIPGMLSGYYIGRLGENLYGLFGCNINQNEKETESIPKQNSTHRIILKGICACDLCNKKLTRGEGVLNNRNSKLYCENCWNRLKNNDQKGEELVIGESWQLGVQRTNKLWA